LHIERQRSPALRWSGRPRHLPEGASISSPPLSPAELTVSLSSDRRYRDSLHRRFRRHPASHAQDASLVSRLSGLSLRLLPFLFISTPHIHTLPLPHFRIFIVGALRRSLVCLTRVFYGFFIRVTCVGFRRLSFLRLFHISIFCSSPLSEKSAPSWLRASYRRDSSERRTACSQQPSSTSPRRFEEEPACSTCTHRLVLLLNRSSSSWRPLTHLSHPSTSLQHSSTPPHRPHLPSALPLSSHHR
jgi:hypothetical protein